MFQEHLFTSKEVWKYLHISKSTFHRLIRSRRLLGYKIGRQWRFHFSDVEACLIIDKRSVRKMIE